MATEHLHQPMGPAARAAGERYEAELIDLLQRAFAEVIDMVELGDEKRRENDALSVVSELAAIAGAKFVMILGAKHPLATGEQVWMSAMSDIQWRIQANLVDYNVQRMAAASLQ